MANRTCDVVVIGGGPGGYVCSIRLGQLKQKVICIEKEEVGGVCLNWGCVPSKALISASHTFEKVKDAGPGMGILTDNIRIDTNKMQDWKEGIVKKHTGGVRGLQGSLAAVDADNNNSGHEVLLGSTKVFGHAPMIQATGRRWLPAGPAPAGAPLRGWPPAGRR